MFKHCWRASSHSSAGICAGTACAKGGKICREREQLAEGGEPKEIENLRVAKDLRKSFPFDNTPSKLKYVFKTQRHQAPASSMGTALGPDARCPKTCLDVYSSDPHCLE